MQQTIELKRGNAKSIWMALTRITLGMLIIWKGLLFTQDTSELQMAIQRTGAGAYAGFLDVIAATVSILTLAGGIFLTVGLFTKVSSYIQITLIVLGLIFIYSTGIQRSALDVVTTIIILPTLWLFASKGSGSISFDEAIEGNK